MQDKTNTTSLSALLYKINSPEFLSSIYGIGETLVNEFNLRISNPKNRSLIQEFEQYGLSLHITNSLSKRKIDKKICITGKFPISRDELEFYIIQSGYIFSPTLTKSTHYLFL